MTKANLEKSSLIVSYHFGFDSHKNPKIVKQTFSQVKALAEDDKINATGLAIATLLNSANINVYKQELIAL